MFILKSGLAELKSADGCLRRNIPAAPAVPVLCCFHVPKTKCHIGEVVTQQQSHLVPWVMSADTGTFNDSLCVLQINLDSVIG